MKDILLNLLALGAILSSVLVITSKNPVISVLYLIAVFINTAGYLILLGIGFIGLAYIIVYIGAITVLFLFVIMMINIKLVDILEVGKEYTKNLPLALAIGFVFLFEILSITSVGSSISATGVEGTSSTILNPISLQFLSYPLDILTQGVLGINNLFIYVINSAFGVLGMDSSSVLGINSIEAITPEFLTVTNTLYNTNDIDANFLDISQIEMLGQGLYTYGAVWLILSSIILLLSMIAPIILSTPSR